MLWDALTAAPRDKGVTFVAGDETTQLSWQELVRAGTHAARGLQERGVGTGDRVGVVLSNSAAAIAGLTGVWFAGATAVSLPVISRGMNLDSYLAQIVRLYERADLRLLLADAPMSVALSASNVGDAIVDLETVAQAAGVVDPAPPPDGAIAFVQFSSGATGEPRGAALTARAIEAQLTALADAAAVDPRADRVSAWLPLSHDMGLFGCVLLSWYMGLPLLLGTPQRFLASPRSWLDDCAHAGATLTAIQPSALRLVSRATRDEPPTGGDLSLRACLVGGERIPALVLDEARELLAARGAAPTALTPAYGLAEATLAVSVGAVDEPPRTCAVDREALLEGDLVEDPPAKRAVRVVSCGSPLRDVSVAVEGEAPVGELRVRSPSLATGYLNDPAATAATFADGALATGDVGFVRDGELYPLARKDDVLNVAGRRINALEVEEALGKHAAIRTGCLAVVDVGDDERVRHVAVAELAGDGSADPSALAQELRRGPRGGRAGAGRMRVHRAGTPSEDRQRKGAALPGEAARCRLDRGGRPRGSSRLRCARVIQASKPRLPRLTRPLRLTVCRSSS